MPRARNLQNCVDAPEIGVRAPPAGETDGLHFQHGAEFVEIGHIAGECRHAEIRLKHQHVQRCLARHVAQVDARLRPALYDAHGFEGRQCLTQEAPADVEAFSQFAFGGQTFARGITPLADERKDAR